MKKLSHAVLFHSPVVPRVAEARDGRSSARTISVASGNRAHVCETCCEKAPTAPEPWTASAPAGGAEICQISVLWKDTEPPTSETLFCRWRPHRGDLDNVRIRDQRISWTGSDLAATCRGAFGEGTRHVFLSIACRPRAEKNLDEHDPTPTREPAPRGLDVSRGRSAWLFDWLRVGQAAEIRGRQNLKAGSQDGGGGSDDSI